MMKAESFISESVIFSGMVRPDAANRGSGEPNVGRVERNVFSGFAYDVQQGVTASFFPFVPVL